MNRIIVLLMLLGLSISCTSKKNIKTNKQKIIEVAEVQYGKIGDVYKSKLIPRTHHKDGSLRSVPPFDWTSGFYGGNMWYMYELTKDDKWKERAIDYTEILDTIQWYSGNHDVGFMINCSYGNGYRVGGKEDYKQVLINAAESLSKRFNNNIGLIKSWNYRKAWNDTTEWFFPVIIDNMMNLELLFEASKLSGNKKYYNIAISHANKTMENHYREDYSSYHVVDYDAITGKVLDKATCQGYADESSWSRGQAWGLYGYVTCYRATKDKKYLDFANNIANYITTHPSIPKDKIPYWDYHVNNKDYKVEWDYQNGVDYLYRDVSAATITASALIELASYLSEEEANNYIDYAKDIINNVSTSKYMASKKEDNYFLLKHSVGSVPHSGDVDMPVNYADYYFLEALSRMLNYEEGRHVLPEKTSIAAVLQQL
ncbi:glycoside hydrolase family 88 protein [Tamlana sp. 2201CG12-4]|uniref:glycoside hydrolase family 88 protein n=1 Tax=Tamlana sp. 2201CG12-4 TaxID=3112582 RepID=UPI002DB8C88A|nr:glycoside hydrolase family 88 protein [Tamlana sp. 2201CG12-4]MEC3908805.1 glycoside hydrolase family 88 protein [Tamlana sp. 2201CG12-4]